MDHLRETTLDWEALADKNPYWAVITDDRWKSTLSDEDKDAFIQTGYDYVHNVRTFADKLGCELGGGTALDFGCGVGRLAIPMAAICESVVGVDAVEAMLTECRLNADRNEITNLSLCSSLEQLKDTGARFTWANSFIVFQHIPPETGYACMRNLLSMVSEGGFVSLHFTYARNASTVVKEINRFDVVSIRNNKIIGLGEPAKKSFPKMLMYDYDLGIVLNELRSFGFHTIIQQTTEYREHHGVLLMGRRGHSPDLTWHK